MKKPRISQNEAAAQTRGKYLVLRIIDYLTPEVELLSYHAFKRVCYTCFDAMSDLEARSLGRAHVGTASAKNCNFTPCSPTLVNRSANVLRFATPASIAGATTRRSMKN